MTQGYLYTEEDELRLRHLLAQTAVCKVINSPDGSYERAIKYLIKKCNKVIAIWDKEADDDAVKSYTSRTIESARQYGLTLNDDIHIISCHT